MIGARIVSADLARLNSKITKLKILSEKELSKEVASIAFDVARIAKQSVVVDTGNLKQNITVEAKGKTLAVVAKAPYAPYVEFGTGGKRNFSDLIELGIPTSYAERFRGKDIRSVNLPPRPFLFSSARIGLLKGLEKIENKIKKLLR
jgi:phage gpG-like protein